MSSKETDRYIYKPGGLWARMVVVSHHAQSIGALQPIVTQTEYIEGSGVQFVVRQVSSLSQKAKLAAEPGTGKSGKNPFLPFEQELYVADITGTHVAILNKYSVLDQHLLVITRDYEDQQALLTTADFEALLCCMREFDSLGFYNAGRLAGASQPHKHLQVVPLPLADKGPAIPIMPWFDDVTWHSDIGTIPQLPFVHGVTRIDRQWFVAPQDSAAEAHRTYQALLSSVGLREGGRQESDGLTDPYNLIVTREWMMLVPRGAERFHGITVNALGYAGAFLVRDEAQMALIKRHGPMAALQHSALKQRE